MALGNKQYSDEILKDRIDELELKNRNLEKDLDGIASNMRYIQGKPLQKVLDKIDILEKIIEDKVGITDGLHMFSPNLAVIYAIRQSILDNNKVSKKQLVELNELYTIYK